VKLPALSASAAPQFVDAASCKDWLDQLPLANVGVAQQELLAELEVYNTFPTSAVQRLAVMEALREAVAFVQVEQAKRFSNRALPMAEAEAAALEDTTELWEQMRLGYLRCLDAGLAGEANMRGQSALITQRLGAYSGLKMFHYFRAYREVPPADWRSLHEVYAHAESLGVAQEPVKDFLNRDVQDSSPFVAYARAVLMGMSSPQELSQRQLTFVAYLLERWASKLEVSTSPVPEEPGVPPLVADLAGAQCPGRLEPGTRPPAHPRYLDTRKLAKTLRNRVGLLRKGESPAKLALGEDCVQPSCEQLLVFLFRQWCQAKPLHAQRRSVAEGAYVLNELETIYRHLGGGAITVPQAERKDLTTQQRQELETLGRIRTAADASTPRGVVLEEWRIEEDSAQGLGLARPAGSPGKRYAHGQLVAVRPRDAAGFILGHVRWLIEAHNGALRAGVKLMPGAVAAVALRPLGLNEKGERVASALSIGAMPALKSPATLVLPMGWFKPNRMLETVGERPARLRLVELVERGIDFERATYEQAA
jgi:cyclic-di-GMP-binding protein